LAKIAIDPRRENRQSTVRTAAGRKRHMSAEAPTSAASQQLPIFVYGTLRRGESAEDVIAPDVTRRAPARAKGRLLSINAPYPAAVFLPDATEHVDGELTWLAPASYEAALDRIDAYENVPFLFRRIAITVEAEGAVVKAWAYTYTHASHEILPQTRSSSDA
jgi:gamma-glutamylcyclotransferase (GGCT)/AIG2-like uncharacterized protein YtfP